MGSYSKYTKLLFTILLLLGTAIDGINGDAMVSGTVFCDQCKDGQVSFFDYPVNGAKVTLTCTDSNGEILMSREETTNWFGNYAMRFDGTPDLSNCNAQVSGGNSSGCGVTAGPAKKLTLTFRMFGMEMYAVDSLLSQPAEPMSFCPKSPAPAVRPPPPTPLVGSPPPFRLPPMPRLPPLLPMPPLPSLPPMPPLPFLEASACPHQRWIMPEYKCYWRALSPESKVAVVFGPLAGRKYGSDMTLWQALQGRGEPYRTLLREATTALLNSYNSLQFPYHSVTVLTHTNWALMGSKRSVLLTALRFIRANSGITTKTPCRFAPCK
ncbi:uncharacterized protein LOC110816521 [Carica papaya]|uniref:uncharacterized protein LOC110816521 n=1 Tax=Carica papaya TaxID=3649 RepID=UPI000B8C8D4B|nr:uncharacterized protein LOC110816521 [Carica papaya]